VAVYSAVLTIAQPDLADMQLLSQNKTALS